MVYLHLHQQQVYNETLKVGGKTPTFYYLERKEIICMTDNTIKLNKDNILRLQIVTDKGEDTGECLEFDLEDIELLLRYQELIEIDKKNKEHLKNEFIIIDKRQDVKGKKLLSKNEEDKLKALNDFFNKEKEVYNMFLGERGVEKLLNGRKLGWTSLQEIDEIIEKQIAPYLDINMKTITDKVKAKYGKVEQSDVLE
jgi:predicted RNA-binding protein (virulence factor B family)